METALNEDHGPVSQVGNVDFAFESGVDGVDLTFSKEEALKVFARRDLNGQERSSAPFTAQDLLEALAAKKISRTYVSMYFIYRIKNSAYFLKVLLLQVNILFVSGTY